MEPKDFFEVFPTLVLKEKAAGYMTGTTVLRVSSTKNRHLLKIYIKSTHIIPKSIILEVQKEIEKQLFGESEIDVRIYERFELSDSYSITTVFESYRESMEKELSESSLTLYDAFHNSRLSFSENNTVNIQIPDRFLYREKQRELEDYIEKVITDRFGMGLILNIDYYELPEGELSKENELKVAMRVKEIADRIGAGIEKETVYLGDVPKESKNSEDAAGKKTAKEDAGRSEAKSDAAAKADTSVQGSSLTGADESGKKGSVNKFLKKVPERGEFKKGEYKIDFRRGELKRSDNPDVIYGVDIDPDAEFTRIEDIIGDIGDVVIRGEVTGVDSHPIKNEKTIFKFDITDYTDTISAKIFLPTEKVKEFEKEVKPGAFLKVKAFAKHDPFDHEVSLMPVSGIMRTGSFVTPRADHALHKRVELHCHTKMSDMDGVSEAKDIVKRAYKWGTRL